MSEIITPIPFMDILDFFGIDQSLYPYMTKADIKYLLDKYYSEKNNK